MNVVITGGAGFLGSRLARELLAAGTLDVAGGGARPLSRVTLIDQAPVPPDLAADERVTAIQGDLGQLLDPLTSGPDTLSGADVVFHLAAAVSGECETDFDLGIRANLRATEALLASARAVGTSPVVVFSSSLAVFGGSEDLPLPEVVDDQTRPNPQTSYGAQKAMSEQLLADYTRKGFLRGRALRLVSVSVRPGRPNAAASGFMSGVIREPLAGQRAICPVTPETEVALASPAKAIAGLLSAATASDEAWGGRTAVNLPALTISLADMSDALARVAGPEVSALIDWVPDPDIARMVASWPARVRADRAARLGLTPDPDFDSIIRMHMAESRPGGERQPLNQTVITASGPCWASTVSSSNQTPPSARYRKCRVLPARTVTAALRVWFARFRIGWVYGFQSLKSPTTETAPPGSSMGRANVTRTVPSRPGLDVLIT